MGQADAGFLYRGLPNLSDFEEVYVYGDTIEDREMLSLGTKRFYQWQEVANDFFA